MPIVYRSGSPEKPVYHDASGKKITDAAVLEYIKSLRIPPAYTGVEIHIVMRGNDPCAPPKMTYKGIDTAGRIQYGYSKTHKTRAAKEKFNDLIAFGLALPKIRAKIMSILKDPNVTQKPDLEVAIALILRIILLCHFRLGNERYKRLYKSYGISTLEVRHLKFVQPTAISRIKVPCAKFSFIGKKGVKNDCCISEPDVVAHLANMIANKGPKDPIFSTADGQITKATDINEWLRQFGVDLSSKQFRTYAGSTMLIHLLNAHAHRNKEIEHPESLSSTERKRTINAALDRASETIHNTRAVCKKEYCHPAIIEMYLEHPRKYASLFIGKNLDPEKAFMDFLIKSSKTCKADGGDDETQNEIDPSDIWFDH